VIVAVFVVVWVIALAIWKYGKIEQKWDLAAAAAQNQGVTPEGAGAGHR
jgi:hypothetical protein